MFGSFISTHTLASVLNKVKVLDGSWHMPNTLRDPYTEYLEGHIPTAGFFGIDTHKDTTNPLPHMLPRLADFNKAMNSMGIMPEDSVVVYDSIGTFSACRVYWTFKAFGHDRVSVLEGGLPQWLKEQRPLETGAKTVTDPTQYYAVYRPSLVSDYDAVLANAKLETRRKDKVQVVDARPYLRFTGEAPEPREGLSSGHIPGSVSLPYNEVINGEGQLLSKNELALLFEKKKVDLSKPIICTCGSGITASILYMAMKKAGATKVSVYDGSWTEYATNNEWIQKSPPGGVSK
ncbi:Rhodanese-like domain-containing protein [Spinellus fusiger]|nr:Rhodanese-like domain-containing protein [Spinellus fusiger]